MQTDRSTIIRILQAVFEPGDVFEIRALEAKTASMRYTEHVVSGYYTWDHIETAADDVGKILEAKGVYFTPNPVIPDLIARAYNRLRDVKSARSQPSTADTDIMRRRWLLIDCDAVRKSGISSTEEEHSLALAKAAEIRDGFRSMGFPDPIELDSGNGAQLMYRVNLPPEDDTVHRILERLNSSVSSSGVSIDTSVGNAARIWRLSGTMNCKGDNVPELGRVNRMASIIRIPDAIDTVPAELLSLASNFDDKGATPPDIPPKTQNASEGLKNGISGLCINLKDVQSVTGTPFDGEEWVRKHFPEATPEPWKDGVKWQLETCPFDPSHHKSAVITRQASGAMGFTCHHNSCQAYGWHELRDKVEPGWSVKQQPSQPVKLEPVPQTQPEPEPEEEPEPERPAPWRSITAKDVKELIKGTKLGDLTAVYASVTDPKLPIECALAKAIVTAGCAMSQQLDDKDLPKTEPGRGILAEAQGDKIEIRGSRRARLRINTADGQVCNSYVMLAAPSASGKDIGNLLEEVTGERHWLIGSSGSAEGIAEALKKRGNGLLTISEFGPWLDEQHWQHKASLFLTDAFGKGWFRHNFSPRSVKGGVSECLYCYPNIFASIQPETLERVARAADLQTGFLGRFLFLRMPDVDVRPACGNFEELRFAMNQIIPCFEAKRGIVDVPPDYSAHLHEVFRAGAPEWLAPSWKRLANQYYPRLAVMLSVTDESPDVVITDDTWKRAETLTLWLFANAERLLCDLQDDDPQTRKVERLMRTLLRIIARNDKGDGVNMRTISHRAIHTGTTAEQRRQLLAEMEERGIIISDQPGKGCPRGCRVRVLHAPPGWLEE